jgi:hypothetical protein
MGISSKLRVVKQRYQAVSTSHGQVWQNSNLLALARRSGLKLTGAFLLLAIAAVAVIGNRASAANSLSSSPAASSDKQVTVQVSHSASSTPAATPAAPAITTSPDTDVSSNTTTNSSGTSSTQVTVNGQPVAVPANGSTQQTVNGPGQTTTVQVSNNQAGSGDAQTSSFSHTDIHTSTNSEEDTTP